MRFVIITGLSGAGKSHAVRSMEDMGYYCVDNMPPELIPKFAELCHGSQGNFDNVAVVCDARGGKHFGQIFNAIDELTALGYQHEILFLDASDEVLLKRFKETRRSHPLGDDDRLGDAIAQERIMLSEIMDRATHVIDTSDKMPRQLKKEITANFAPEGHEAGIRVNIVTFGFKYGLPKDSDLVFDVRFLPNPFYIPELKKKSGLDPDVSGYVMQFDQAKQYLAKLKDWVDFTLPLYAEEGRANLVISIGCTGGRHRSVTIAEKLLEHLKSRGAHVFISHRDKDKGLQPAINFGDVGR